MLYTTMLQISPLQYYFAIVLYRFLLNEEGVNPHISHQKVILNEQCLDFSYDTYDLLLIQPDKFTKIPLFNLFKRR